MGLQNRPRFRALKKLARTGAGWASVALTYEVPKIEDTELMQEAKAEARKALAECRQGNLEPHAFVLYGRTIHPELSRLSDARKLGYGIRPEEIGSYHHEIREFWLWREAARAEQWIDELKRGNTRHSNWLRCLCAQYIVEGDDFIGRLSLSLDELEELVGVI